MTIFSDTIPDKTGLISSCESIANKLRERLGIQIEFMICSCLGDAILLLSAEEIARRWQVAVFPDGKEVYSFDGRQVFEVLPLEFCEENGKYVVSQRINRLRPNSQIR